MDSKLILRCKLRSNAPNPIWVRNQRPLGRHHTGVLPSHSTILQVTHSHFAEHSCVLEFTVVGTRSTASKQVLDQSSRADLPAPNAQQMKEEISPVWPKRTHSLSQRLVNLQGPSVILNQQRTLDIKWQIWWIDWNTKPNWWTNYSHRFTLCRDLSSYPRMMLNRAVVQDIGNPFFDMVSVEDDTNNTSSISLMSQILQTKSSQPTLPIKSAVISNLLNQLSRHLGSNVINARETPTSRCPWLGMAG